MEEISNSASIVLSGLIFDPKFIVLPNSNLPMNFIDLFCGAGGLSLGLQSAGLDCYCAIDGDTSAITTKKKNVLPHVQKNNNNFCCDIKDLHKRLFNKELEIEFQSDIVFSKKSKNKLQNTDLEKAFELLKDYKVGDVDLVVGGPPCQGFSNASRGKKKEIYKVDEFIDDDRNILYKYFLDFVNYINPKFVLIENVSGLLSSKNYASLITKSLAATGLGYEVNVVSLDASMYKVAQARNRVFFFGFRKDLRQSFKNSFYLENLLLKKSSNKIYSVRDAIDDLPSIKSNPKKNNYSVDSEIEFGNEQSFGAEVSRESYSQLVKITDYNHEINLFRGQYIKPNNLYNHKARFNNKEDLKIYSLLSPGRYLDHPENKEALALCRYDTTYTNKDGKEVKSFQDKYFKIDPNKPSRTIVAHLQMDTNGYVHYGDIPRGITPREAARLQSFPDWYRFYGSFTSQYRQIGNAVPPLLGKVLGELFISFDADSESI